MTGIIPNFVPPSCFRKKAEGAKFAPKGLRDKIRRGFCRLRKVIPDFASPAFGGQAKSGIILAGGRNTRMQGEDKAFLELEGRTIISGLIDKMRPLTDEIIVVTNSPGKYDGLGVRLVKDQMPGKGPLMGIYCGLKASASKYNFVIACDMPFLKVALLKYFLDTAAANFYDIIISKSGNKAHPLFGIYSRGCIPVMEEHLKQDRLKISDIFPLLKTRFVAKEEIERFDKELASLTNINTREEYELLKRGCILGDTRMGRGHPFFHL